ncbi:MAG: methyltransferase domain-containing protein [Deltaproteobacteria bacterium]|nr:methyltransferase domain-containing protein [Deltaproteobacteria bacterium]MBW2071055.1 methyltransferase domain-containing protein [Deltaproteobacteria bacterium]
MKKSNPPKYLKAHVRALYQRIAACGSANLSRAPVASGAQLAAILGYPVQRMNLPAEAWQLFAACGNPLQGVEVGLHWRVLDLGCGVGIDAQLVATGLKRPGLVVGLDLTLEMVQLANTYCGEKASKRCLWVVADGEDIPCKEETFNLVVANGSFNLMPHKERALTEIFRVLLPGGLLVIVDLVRLAEVEGLDQAAEDAWTWCLAGALSAAEFDSLFDGAGFCRWELQHISSFEPFASVRLLAHKEQRPL